MQFYRDEILKGGVIDWESLYPGSRDLWEEKALGDIATNIYRGVGKIVSQPPGAGMEPAIKNNISSLPRKLYNSDLFIDPASIKGKSYCEHGDIIISANGFPNAGRNCVYLGAKPCILGRGTLGLKHNENPNFLSWALRSSDWQRTTRNLALKPIFPQIFPKDIKLIKIPMPPRPIQDLIANHLDQLYEQEEQMEKELLAEIEHRNKQVKQILEELLEYDSSTNHTNTQEI